MLNGTAEPVEITVKMRQLNETDAMLSRLRRASLKNDDIRELVDRLVDFYIRSPPISQLFGSSVPAWEENLLRIEPYTGKFIDQERFSFVREASHTFFDQWQPLFQRRMAKGMIRDGHGDLRCDHIYFTTDGIQIIDCIEFNDGLRIIDPISDLAFLAMDLEHNGFLHTAQFLIREYIIRANDIGALPLLDFYRCYRAMVRCKVNCILIQETGLPPTRYQSLQKAADTYLSLACKYAMIFSRPILWVVCGLPASGKSTIAKALADVYLIEVIRSDVVRKKLFAREAVRSVENGFESGIYSARATEVTYDQLFNLSRKILNKRKSVVIDATFSNDKHRRTALSLAVQNEALLVFVECQASDAMSAQRLQSRETEPSISDARLTHFKRFKERYEPMIGIAPAIQITVDTEQPLASCLQHILFNEALWRTSPSRIDLSRAAVLEDGKLFNS